MNELFEYIEELDKINNKCYMRNAQLKLEDVIYKLSQLKRYAEVEWEQINE